MFGILSCCDNFISIVQGKDYRLNGIMVPLLQGNAKIEATWDKQIAEMKC